MGFEEWAHRVFVLGDDDETTYPPAEILRGATEVCLNAGRLADMYGREQLSDGLWHFAGLFLPIYQQELPEDDRLLCVGSIRTLYTDLFEPYCDDDLLGHVQLPDQPPAPPLNTICYMWWDNFPSWGHPDEPATLPIDEALIGLMREQLDSRNLAVVESGLHGLGHWQFHYPGEVATIVDDYLNRHPSADLVIRQYATWARNGHVM